MGGAQVAPGGSGVGAGVGGTGVGGTGVVGTGVGGTGVGGAGVGTGVGGAGVGASGVFDMDWVSVGTRLNVAVTVGAGVTESEAVAPDRLNVAVAVSAAVRVGLSEDVLVKVFVGVRVGTWVGVSGMGGVMEIVLDGVASGVPITLTSINWVVVPVGGSHMERRSKSMKIPVPPLNWPVGQPLKPRMEPSLI